MHHQESELMSLKVPIYYTIYYTTSVLDSLPRFSPLANLPHYQLPLSHPLPNPPSVYHHRAACAGVQREYLDGFGIVALD